MKGGGLEIYAPLPHLRRFPTDYVTTLNVGRIEGGVATNVMPENGSAKILVRVTTEDVQSVKEVIEKAVEGISPWLEVNFSNYGIGPAPIDYDVEGKSLCTAPLALY
jgi:metal-dependent amidase/aminoacylase/carboxypeptidase family protein